ncbi:MAG: malto-oligosyltrehalose synthase [Acidimicrobiaceae bacterium]|nr:malto-oligosyltrehalose synthase [Acidimicrobiaceae bacterium]
MADVDGAATYRVQLHPGFGFDDAATIVDYLADLGVSHLYCSPYLQAAPGSTHGYDVADPQRLNVELGGFGSYDGLTDSLREHGLGQVLDIVPNHMVTDATNPWWWDVLANGAASRFADVFDIDWNEREDGTADTVLVPVLGDHYGRVLEAGELSVERTGAHFTVRYFDHRFPVAPRTLDEVLELAAPRASSDELAAIATGFATLPLPTMNDAAATRMRHDAIESLTARLARLIDDQPACGVAIDDELGALVADVDRLDAFLARQNYRLASWRTASDELDYRRFFNIDSLIGVRVEDPDVFATTHELILRLVRDGVVDGLRIDHVDGLRDPAAYLERLVTATDGAYVVVEKILEGDEVLPPWPVAGTSGYDFLVRTNELFVDARNEAAMTACYESFIGESTDFERIVRDAKHQIMGDELVAEVERATALLSRICDHHRRHRDHTRRELRDALREFVAAFPVYRTYVAPERPTSDTDRRHIEIAGAETRRARPDIDGELVDFLGRLAAGDEPDGLEFAMRLQQLTAPVMAKGIEDTAFYRYHRLVSLNEVGGDPTRFGGGVEAFHAAMAIAAADWPSAMLTLSTHDTKRSADVRARLNVLSEVPVAWADTVVRLAELATPHRTVDDLNTEYLLYQTLVGAWPLDAERAVAFIEKATREAKVHTSWIDPDAEYDAAIATFTRAVLADGRIRAEIERFLRDERIVERGRRNSLAQTALLLTCPGVPDTYQGSELWDLSLVDPDNRRPVDFELRRRVAAETAASSPGDVLRRADRGDPKLWMTRRLLRHRRGRPGSFSGTEYQPVDVRGERSDDVVAFARRDLAVVVPRLGGDDWNDTAVELGDGPWNDVLTGRRHEGGDALVTDLLGDFPVAVIARGGS